MLVEENIYNASLVKFFQAVTQISFNKGLVIESITVRTINFFFVKEGV